MSALLSGQGRDAEAAAKADEAAALHASAEAELARGNALKGRKDWAAAAAAFRRATELDGALVAAWVGLGRVLHELKQKEDAKEAYCTALRLAAVQREEGYLMKNSVQHPVDLHLNTKIAAKVIQQVCFANVAKTKPIWSLANCHVMRVIKILIFVK